MTAEQIAELRRLDAEATPRPWGYGSGDLVAHNGCYLIDADASVLVAARNALPRLLDEREALLTALNDIASWDLDEAALDELAMIARAAIAKAEAP